MEKTVVCPKCHAAHVLASNHGAKEIAQHFACKKCGEVTKVMWPVDMGWSWREAS